MAAQILLPLGIVLAVKADCGISVASSATYVLSLIVEKISFGTFNYLYQGVVFLLMLIIIREVKLQYFLSFMTAVIFGYVIDLWVFILRGYVPESLPVRLIIFLISLITMSFAIATFIRSGLPLLPFDIFVRKVSAKFNMSFGRLKLIFDLSNLVVAVVLSLAFFSRLIGISWGTFVFGFALGPTISFFLKQYERIFD